MFRARGKQLLDQGRQEDQKVETAFFPSVLSRFTCGELTAAKARRMKRFTLYIASLWLNYTVLRQEGRTEIGGVHKSQSKVVLVVARRRLRWFCSWRGSNVV